MFKNSTYLSRFIERGKQIGLICLMMMSFSLVMAQERQVSGTILDNETGDAIPGVNILIKGTTQGTVTDINGQYQLLANPGDVLAYSSVGFVTQEIIVGNQNLAGNQNTININLSPDIQALAEVVVTGYSVDKRRETTGSVSVVEPADLTAVPSGNVEQQLQGRVAGVTVITNGQPGTTSQVRIRGYGALGGNEPLYIVDGVPVESTNFLSPDDIETTTVLKDATAAAIYGARAAGGVIVYTTRQGKKGSGPMKVTYNGMVGVTTPGSPDTKLNPQGQADWTWNAIRNAAIQNGVTPEFNHPQYGTGSSPVLPDWLLVGPDAGIIGAAPGNPAEDYNVDFDAGPIHNVIRANKQGVDWYDAITQDAIVHRHNIGLYGGGEGNRFYVGLSMQDQEGIVQRQKFERYTMRVNTEFDIVPGKVRIGENIQATYRAIRQLQGGGGGAGSADDENLILTASRMSPIIPIFNEFGGWAGTAAPGFNNARNPMATIEGDANDRNFAVQVFGNVYLEAEPIENLVVRTSFGGRYENFNSVNYTRRQYENSENNAAFSFGQNAFYTTNWVWTNTINYSFDVGSNHSFGILAGQEALNTGTFKGINGSGINPFSESTDFVNLSTVENRVVNGGNGSGINFSSYFGRLTYDYKDKFLVTGVVRNDGSSRFGEENRRGTFPSFSAGWRISEEAFLSGSNWIDDLKIRGGYGEIGNSNNVDPNNQFSLFATSLDLATYNISGSNSGAQTGFYRNRIGNSAAQWEKAVTTNIGIDALLWDGKVDVVLDIWQKDTEELLFQLPVTVQTGFRAAAPSVNVGEMRNKGVDLKIKAIGNIGSEIGYELTVNASFLDNEITKFSEGIENLPQFSASYRGITPVLNQVGQPLSTFFGFQTDGLFANQGEVDAHATQEGAAPGRFRFSDLNGDGVIDLNDRTSIGNPIPDFNGGVTFKGTWRNWEVEVYGYAVLGNEIYMMSRLFTDFYPLFPGAAISERVTGSWTPDNLGAEIPIFENVSNFSTMTQSSDFFVQDGSYFRLQNLTIGYNIPTPTLDRWGLTRFRVFATANNLFTISGYEGLDPAVGGEADVNFGIDLGNIPITRQYTLGVNVSF